MLQIDVKDKLPILKIVELILSKISRRPAGDSIFIAVSKSPFFFFQHLKFQAQAIKYHHQNEVGIDTGQQ